MSPIFFLSIVAACVGIFFISDISFYLFCKLFGVIDNYMQDRHFAKRGFSKMAGEDGQEWYVGYGD
jgi:hypothetical protein